MTHAACNSLVKKPHLVCKTLEEIEQYESIRRETQRSKINQCECLIMHLFSSHGACQNRSLVFVYSTLIFKFLANVFAGFHLSNKLSYCFQSICKVDD